MSANIIKYEDNGMMSYPMGLNLRENLRTIALMSIEINKLYEFGSIALWCRGSSGLIIGGIICAILVDRKIVVNHMKKPDENSHNDVRIRLTQDHNMIVDDFCSTGETIYNMLMEMRVQGINSVDLCISGKVRVDMLEKFDNIICTKDPYTF